MIETHAPTPTGVLTRPRRHTEPELEFNPLIDKLRLERLNRSTATENHS